MVTDELTGYIRQTRKAGASDDEIRKQLAGMGWQEKDIAEAFGVAKKPLLGWTVYLAVLAAVLVLAGIFYIYPNFIREEKIAISTFELSAGISDAAGVSPDTTFILKSSADLDESAVKKYLSVEPKVEIKIDKTGDRTFEIRPKEKLPENQILTVKIEEGPLAERAFSWAYQVKAPFQIVSTLPRDKGASVPMNSGIEITFNRENPIDPEKYFEISPQAPGRFEIHRNTLVFVPTQELKSETVYTVTVKKGLKIKGSDDVLPEDKVFKFETGTKGYRYSYFYFNKLFWEFKPDIEPAFEVGFYDIPKTSGLPANLYRFDSLEEFTNSYKDYLTGAETWSQFNKYKEYRPAESKKIFEGSLSVENQLGVRFIRIPQKTGEGFYLFHITIDDKPYQVWFQVSDLANYLSASPTKSLVWLRSLNSGQPVKDAELFFENKVVGRTDGDGIAQFDTPPSLVYRPDSGESYYSASRFNFYILQAQGKKIAIPVDFYGVSFPDQWWDHMSLDKNIYQPNDTVRFWGIAKQRNGTDIKGEELTVRLTDPYWRYYGYGGGSDQRIYAETKAKVSDFYTVTGELNLGGIKPGLYNLEVRRGNETIASENVNVETYIKPAYRLILTPLKNGIFAGDSAGFKVRGEFFDGTPVSDLEVKYSGYLNTYITGQIKLDRNGEATFYVKTDYQPSDYWPKYLDITVSPAVAEEGEIAKNAFVLVFGAEFDIRLSQTVSQNLTKIKLNLNKIDPERSKKEGPFWDSEGYLGDPVSDYPVTVEVKEVGYTRTETRSYDIINKVTYPVYSYTQFEKSIRRADLRTDSRGELNFDQLLEKDKSYLIIFSTKDTKGRIVSESISAYGGNVSPFYYYSRSWKGVNLSDLRTTKGDYKIGDKVSLQMQDNAGNPSATAEKGFLFYKVSGNGISTYQVKALPDYNDVFNDGDTPNAKVVGVWFGGDRFHSSEPVNLSFDAEERRLSINIKKDRARYKPGEKVNIDLEVKSKDGRAKEAEVNISAIDEALLELGQDNYWSWFSFGLEEKDIVNDLYRDVYVGVAERSSHLSPAADMGAEIGGCFAAGTKVRTVFGDKNIEDIKIGDRILTREDESSNRLVEARVEKTSAHLVPGYLVINEKLRVTEEHSLFVNGRWLKAGQVKIGDRLIDMNGKEIPVDLIRKVDEWLWVYNFEVDRQHTYFADGFYVHNQEKGGGEARGEFKDVAIYKTVKTGSDGKANVKFDLPDNITSWKLIFRAISEDWFAGNANELVPVGLPFFVDVALNRVYLAGDAPIIRTRVFGSAGIKNNIRYKVESDTLPFKLLEKTGFDNEEFLLGQLTPGKHKIKISADAPGYNDAIVREIEVLNTYFSRNARKYYELSPSLSGIEGNSKGLTELLLTSRERGRLYWPLLSFSWSYGARVDQFAGRSIADILLNRFFNRERRQDLLELRQYQTQNGGIALLPYSDDDLALSAKLADLIKGEASDISTDTLKQYFYNSLKDKKTDLSRIVMSLYGLAALNEPVLVSLQNIKNESGLTLTDKAFVALALDTIGAKEDARRYYLDNFKPVLFTKLPYMYVEKLANKDDNIVLTAMLASLAGSLDEPEAEYLANYVLENRPKETLINFEVLGYIKKTLPNLKGGDISFTYVTDKKREAKTLKNDETFELLLDADELRTLRFEAIDGRVGLVSSYEAASSPEEIVKDPDIGLRRSYSVNGRPTAEFKSGDLVKIELASSFQIHALPGLYQITDYLPSGLRAVTRLSTVPYRAGTCVAYPSMIEDQKITFIDWNPKYDCLGGIYYYARVVNPGTYKAEPALLQSLKNLDSQNLSAPAVIKIK